MDKKKERRRLIVNRIKINSFNKKRRKKLKKVPRPLQPVVIEKSYGKELKKLIKQLEQEIREQIISQLGYITEVARFEKTLDTSSAKLISIALNAVRIRATQIFNDKEVEKIITKYAERTSDFQRKEMERQFNTVLGVNPLLTEPYLATEMEKFLETNISLIKTIPENMLNKVESLIRIGVETGEATDTISSSIVNQFGVTERRADLIARDQVAKFNSSLNQLRQKEVGVEKYEWSTSGDERVREEHEALNGEIFGWEEETPIGFKPGEDINCYHKDTEVYTDKGFILLRDVKLDDNVLTLEPYTQNLEWSKCIGVYSKFADKVVDIKGQSFNLSVDLKHRFFTYKKHEKNKKLCSKPLFTNGFNNLSRKTNRFYISSKWVGKDIDYKIIGNQKIPIKDFCIFMGYYLSEGNIDNRDSRNGIKISQSKYRLKMFNDLKFFNPKLGKDSIWIFNTELREYLKKFGKSYEKYIPYTIKQLTKNNIRLFLDAYCLGDGSLTKKNILIKKNVNMYNRYYTSSKKMAHDLSECIIKTGMGVTISEEKTKGKKQTFKNGIYICNHNIYKIYELKKNYVQFYGCKSEIIDYNDIVYDIEVSKNNTILIKYNNNIHWNSNCRCVAIPVMDIFAEEAEI